jgi:hypothetical protein
VDSNDAFGIPFEGGIDCGVDEPGLLLATCRHKLKFAPGTSSLEAGVLQMTDVARGVWKVAFDIAWPAAPIVQCGYHPGGRKDGRAIATYHGSADLYVEWDEFDFLQRPTTRTLYGQTTPRTMYGVEHATRLEITDSSSQKLQGLSEVQVVLNGRYSPCGFEAQTSQGGVTGRGLLS